MRRLILLAMLVLPSCSSGNDLVTANAAIAQFHSELNAGEFTKIYADSAAEWKQASSQADSIQLFTGVRQKLGAFVSGKQNSWQENYGTGGTNIVVLYDSKFEKGDAQETFTFRPEGKSARLLGYNVNSRALITG